MPTADSPAERRMRAVRYDAFGATPYVADVPVPSPGPAGVVVRVEAAGLCRSDWHGWQGHDPDISVLPHTPGHEFAGVVEAVGDGVTRVRRGDRVVVPFVCGCGSCAVCRSGNAQVCPNQWQPGFHGPGCFGGYVAIPWADVNVVRLPDELAFDVVASLGCRFATAYRGIVDVARVGTDETVAVFGCGGVGLAAVMVARSRGAQVVAVDVNADALSLADRAGAAATIDASRTSDVVAALVSDVPQGVDVTVDALGSIATASAAVRGLKIRGRHLQIGLLPPDVVGDRATVPMHLVVSRELTILGSHGMAAVDYPRMLADITAGRLDPGVFITRQIALDDVPAALVGMSTRSEPGVTIVRP